jgi:hypothetical protein
VLVPVFAGVTDCEPLVVGVPDQSPEAVQDVAFVLDQVMVTDCPSVIVAGFAVIEIVGAGGLPTALLPLELPHPFNSTNIENKPMASFGQLRILRSLTTMELAYDERRMDLASGPLLLLAGSWAKQVAEFSCRAGFIVKKFPHQ